MKRLLNCMLVKRKDHSDDALPILVEINDPEELFCSELDGSDNGPYLKVEDVLFPREYDENFPKYLASAVQGILSNPRLVKDWDDIYNNKTSNNYNGHSLHVLAEEVALRLCYEDPFTEYVPLEESFVKEDIASKESGAKDNLSIYDFCIEWGEPCVLMSIISLFATVRISPRLGGTTFIECGIFIICFFILLFFYISLFRAPMYGLYIFISNRNKKKHNDIPIK